MSETPLPPETSSPSPPPGEPTPGRSAGGSRRRLGPTAPLLVAALVLLALLTSYFVFLRKTAGSRPVTGGEVRKKGIAIFPFAPSGGAEDLGWYGQAVGTLLPLVLEESPDLRVLTPERLHDLAGGHRPADEAAELDLSRKGLADYLMRGEVSGGESGATLTAFWIDVATGQEATRWVISGITPATLGRRLDELAARVRGTLALPAPPASDPSLYSLVPTAEGPTRSFLDAADLLSRGDPDGCLRRLKEAVEVSDFYLAQFLQAYAAGRRGDPRTAVQAATKLDKVTRPLPARVTLLTPVILALYGSGNPRTAVAPLEAFLIRFPDEKYPLTWLGAIEVLLTREPARAVGHLERAVALDPANSEARRLLGQATLQAGHPNEAGPILEAYLRARPDDEQARRLLADSYRRTGRAEEARRSLLEILGRTPEDTQAVELLGNILIGQGRMPEAREAYARLQTSKNPVLQSEGDVLLARTYLLEGRFQEALRRYRVAADQLGKAGNPVARARQLMALAEAQTSLGKYPEALVTFSEVRGIESGEDPDLPMINAVVGQKQFDAARKMLDQQMARWEGRVSPALLGRLRDSLEGHIALEEGRYADAVTRLQAALPPSNREMHQSEALGRAYLGADENERAEKIFQRIVEDPDRFSQPVLFVRALAYLGVAREKQGKNELARDAFREVLKWWGNADFTLPEIERARQGVRRLDR